MPSIPLYGYDELEPSVLNNAKRRIVGLMDTSQEALTEKADKDPTGGKQNSFVEKLTEEIYATIKDIEVLDSYISDTSSITQLRLLNRTDTSSLKALRTELKKGASQIASVNNNLRRINATYDTLRPNMVYTDLKIFTYFANSVKILKQSALAFFNIVDDLIEDVIKTEDPTSTYVKPTINEDDEDIETPPIEPDQSISGVPLGELSNEPPIEYSPTPIPGPDPPTPPPKKKIPIKLGKKMKEYKALIRKVLNDANVLDPQIAVDFEELAIDKVRNDKTFYDEAELQGILTTLLTAPAPAPAPAPSTAPPTAPAPAPSPAPAQAQFNYTQQEEDDLLKYINSRIPKVSQEQGDEIQDSLAELFQNSAPNLPTEDEVDEVIDNIIDNPFSQAPTALASSSSTPKDTIESLIDSADELIDGAFLYNKTKDKLRDAKILLLNYQKAKKDTTTKERELRALVNIGEAPYLKASVPIDLAFKKKYPEFGTLKTAYMKSRKDLNTNYKKTEKKFESYMDTNNIPNEYIDKPT